jgi:hypothetical protein
MLFRLERNITAWVAKVAERKTSSVSASEESRPPEQTKQQPERPEEFPASSSYFLEGGEIPDSQRTESMRET